MKKLLEYINLTDEYGDSLIDQIGSLGYGRHRRAAVKKRNLIIAARSVMGEPIDDLSWEYGLKPTTIKEIISTNKWRL